MNKKLHKRRSKQSAGQRRLTSLIIGLATENIPIPPVANAVKVIPRR
jgi:hypothetical protein